MISKYYQEHIEKRKFYCMAINKAGNSVGGWVDTVRAAKNAYEIVKCDFNLSQGLILEKYINKVKHDVIVADTKEIAGELFREAVTKGLITVVGKQHLHEFKIDLDSKYKSLVDQKIIEDKGEYFNKGE